MTTRTDERIRALEGLALLSGCTRRQLQAAASLCTPVWIEPGMALFTEGHPSRQAYLIEDGAAEITVRGQPIHTMGPGECAGDVALLDRGLSPETVIALTPLLAHVLSPTEFYGLLDVSPIIAQRLAKGLARRLRSVEAYALHAALFEAGHPAITNTGIGNRSPD